MRRFWALSFCVSVYFGMWLDTANAQQVRRPPANEYRDKMKAAWVGQFVAAA